MYCENHPESESGFSLIELVVIIAVLATLLTAIFPWLIGFIETASTSSSQIALINAHKECRAQLARDTVNPTYKIPKNNSYFQFPDSGSDGYCLSPSSGNILTAARTSGQQISIFNLNINVVTGEKSSDRDVPDWVEWGSKYTEADFLGELAKAAERGVLLEDENKFYTRGDSRYVVVSGQTWEQAQENAEALGGNLVTIENDEENTWISSELYGDNKVSELLEGKGAAFWTGLNDKNSEGDWVEKSGESNEYRNWAPGEPDKKSGENYAIYLLFDSYNRDPGMWNDQPNDGQVQYGLAEIKIDQ